MTRAHRTHLNLSMCQSQRRQLVCVIQRSRQTIKKGTMPISSQRDVCPFSLSDLSIRRVRSWNGADSKERYSKTRITIHTHIHMCAHTHLHTSKTNHVSSLLQAPEANCLASIEDNKALNMIWDWHILKLWKRCNRFYTQREKVTWHRTLGKRLETIILVHVHVWTLLN